MKGSKTDRRRTALPLLLAVAAGFIAWFQFELSDQTPVTFLAAQWPLYAPLNALTAFCVTLLVFALTGRWWVSTAVSGGVFTVLAVVNYYCRDLHGAAVMVQDVLNLATAAEVMGSYTLQISGRVLAIAALALPLAALVAVQRRLEAGLPRRGVCPRRWLGCAAGIFAVFFFGYFGPWTVRPRAETGWQWQQHYYTYGFLAGSVDAASLLFDPVIQPAGYTDEAAADAAPRTKAADTRDRPDIVLILSESFYDFSLVTDLQADTEVMPVTRGLDNAIHAHTVSPHVGGGTNNSEYTLLTSNSMQLIPSITPFNFLELEGANSFVRYLEDLGYATLAAHPYTAANYRRDTAWQALGFDETHFIESFPTQETYGARSYQTDSASYRDLLALYEAMPEEQPRFAFLVSIQSHGDYDMNDASLDLVHAGTDYGSYDSVMDEYLSCMALSDAAVGELCSYFTDLYERTGRKVIVAMTGDHAPSFVDHVADKDGRSYDELQILERSTPCLIWANFPQDTAAAPETLDLCAFAPLVARQAGLPLSPYYAYILSMLDTDPVVTGTAAAPNEVTRGYFWLEYNNLGGRAIRNDALFAPAKDE